MKRLFAIIVLCITFLSACSTRGVQVPTGTPSESGGTTATVSQTTADTRPAVTAPAAASDKVSDYFPFTADMRMKYRGIGNEYAEYETYVDYIRDDKIQIRKNNGGTEAVNVYSVRDGTLTLVYSRPETYYKYDYTNMTDREDILLKEPLTEGASWTAADGSPRSITSIDRQVETPAGKYNAIEVTTKRGDSIDRDYYVKGIGLVKTEYKDENVSMTVTSELEKIEEGVPFKHLVRFYFPQFEKERIVYIEREIEIKTNEDMKFKFQKELKTIPESGGLTKTLTENSQVLDAIIDDDKDTVTVDLSADFVKEMNAGTTLESMLLECITDTFGNYYMKSQVAITLDGKPYESGHFLLKQGETFKVNIEGAAQYK